MEEYFKKRIQELKNASGNGNLSHQPWSNFAEWKSCYDFLFSNTYTNQNLKGNIKIKKIEENLDSFINNLNLDNLKVASNILNIWKIRNENLNLVLTTSLLLDEIIKIKSDSLKLNSNDDNKHILSQKIIRVTNLLIDDLKKKKRSLASNMFLVAKEIDFPEFIVEVRHACTHKNLPQLETLNFVIKYLYFWIKENIWDKQYELFKLSEDIFLKFSELIFELKNLGLKTQTKKSENKLKKFESKFNELESLVTESSYPEVKLEIDNLFKLIEIFISSMFEKISIKNNLPVLENINEFSKIYKLLQYLEGKYTCLLFFKFLSQQIFYFVKDLLLSNSETKSDMFNYVQEKEGVLQILAYLANFAHKYDVIKGEFKKDDCRFLIKDIYKKLNFAKDFSLYIYEIFNYFNIVIRNEKDFSNSSEKEIEVEASLTDYLKDLKDIENILVSEKSNKNKDNFIFTYPAGSLIFNQLNYLMKENNNPKDFYKHRQEKTETDKFEKNTDHEEIIKSEENNMIIDDEDFYNRELQNILML
jgi:hypothetical protein